MSARTDAYGLFATALLGSVVLVGALDQSMLVVALPQLGREFATSNGSGLVVSVYVVAATIALPCFGASANRFGAGPSLATALMLFLLGSIACPLATSFPALLAARVLQGAAAGGLGTGAQLLAVERMPVGDRARLQSTMSVVFMLAGLGGPLLGLALLERASWRMLFWINIPILLTQFFLLHLYFKLSVPNSASRPGTSFDATGMLLFAAFVMSLLFSLEHLGGTDSGAAISDRPTSLPLAGFVLLFTAAVLWQRCMTRDDAFIPLGAVGPRIWAVAAISFAHASVLTALPLALATTLHDAHRQLLAQVLATFTAMVPAGAFVSGLRIRRGMQPLRLLAFGALMLVIGLSIAWRLLDGQSAHWLTGIALAGLAAGLAMPAAMISAQLQAPTTHVKSATYLIACFRSLGGACASIAAGSAAWLARMHPLDTGLDTRLAAAHSALSPVLAAAATIALIAALMAWALLCTEHKAGRFHPQGH